MHALMSRQIWISCDRNNISCGYHMQSHAQTIVCAVVKCLIDLTREFYLMHNVAESVS